MKTSASYICIVSLVGCSGGGDQGPLPSKPDGMETGNTIQDSASFDLSTCDTLLLLDEEEWSVEYPDFAQSMDAILCPPDYLIAEQFEIFSENLGADFPVAVGSSSPYYQIALQAYNPGGDQVSIKVFTWSVDPAFSNVVDVQGKNPSHDFVQISAQKDMFDLDVPEAPHVGVKICALNPCKTKDCPHCQPEICDSITVVAVVNIAGSWVVSGDVFPWNIEIQIGQLGDDIYSVFLDYSGVLTDDVVSFKGGDYDYVGIISPARDVIEGDVWSIGSGEHLGTWQAKKKGP